MQIALHIADQERIINIDPIIDKKEFDIETQSSLIECKNISWSNAQHSSIKKQLCKQNKIAQKKGQQFILFFKNPIPETMKVWLNEKNILFFEGT